MNKGLIIGIICLSIVSIVAVVVILMIKKTSITTTPNTAPNTNAPTPKTYLYSTNGNYLVLENNMPISLTKDVTKATPVYIDTFVYSSATTIYPVKTANQQYYISGKNNVATYTTSLSDVMILYSKTSTTYINMIGHYSTLSDVTPPQFFSDGGQQVIWNIVSR